MNKLQASGILTPFPVNSVGQAIALIALARTICLRASYHPLGGNACHSYIPVTHTVWVMGDPDPLTELLGQLKEANHG
jgi:hypothetical protein